MSFKQIMTIASIIEKEAANDDERALIASVMAQSVLQPGFFCSFVVSLVAFVIVDVLNMLPLLLGGRAGLVPMLSLAGREFAVSCAALLICHPVLSFVHRRFTL